AINLTSLLHRQVRGLKIIKLDIIHILEEIKVGVIGIPVFRLFNQGLFISPVVIGEDCDDN
ncbi:MAG: hypothetical protein ACRCZQ_08485, partial [Bacteroidales bacterium]